MKERKTKPRKKLGSTRVDVSLEDRLKYTRMIVIQKMSPKEVSKIFEAEHGKRMASTTYKRWRREGPDFLKEHANGTRVTKKICRPKYKKKDEIKEKFEEVVIRELEKSQVDGLVGIQEVCLKVQASEEFKSQSKIQDMAFHHDYLVRIIRDFNGRFTTQNSTMLVMSDDEKSMEIARLSSIYSQFPTDCIFNTDEVNKIQKLELIKY